MPKLADFDWRVDVKTSSDAITRMSVPTCLLQLKVNSIETFVLMINEVLNNFNDSHEKRSFCPQRLGIVRDYIAFTQY